MKKTLTIIALVIFILSSLHGQYFKAITVESGTPVYEKFPLGVRYLYPQFTDGEVVMRTGTVSSSKLNFNLLLGELEFISNKDTLMIARKKDLNIVTVSQDTFIYRSGYLKLIHSGIVKVLVRDKYKLTDIVKKGAMGAPNRNSAIDSYTAIPTDKQLLALVPSEDLVFRRTLEFYILTSDGDLVDFRKKNIMELYPKNENEIQKFLKTNKINFEEQADVIKLADFLATL
jgi:hypothetical protein